MAHRSNIKSREERIAEWKRDRERISRKKERIDKRYVVRSTGVKVKPVIPNSLVRDPEAAVASPEEAQTTAGVDRTNSATGTEAAAGLGVTLSSNHLVT